MSTEALSDDFLLLIVSSPSGAGKTTLCGRLRSEFPDLRFSVSHTTRRPRPNEVDGREYHFVDPNMFEQMIRIGAFAEWARVHDHLYGTSLKEIEIARATARGVLFDIDHQGARQIKASLPEAVAVFILPRRSPSSSGACGAGHRGRAHDAPPPPQREGRDRALRLLRLRHRERRDQPRLRAAAVARLRRAVPPPAARGPLRAAALRAEVER